MPFKDIEKQRAYQKEWTARRRQQWLDENGPCVICGSTEDLHVDHIDPMTKLSHRVWTWTAHKRLAELAKCQVLCRPHHEAKTAEENRERMGGLRHGTEAMYCKYKCRCEPCRKARSIAKQANRAKRKALGLSRD